MVFHPIKVLNRVTEEYKDFLLTEFRAKDPKLKDALERELDKLEFVAKEPFFQVHRPFKLGKRWEDLPIENKLANVMAQHTHSSHCFLHQSESIEYLMSDNPDSLVVTTGTGSGKTECFLLPAIQNAIDDEKSFKKSGLTAILLYPMNALANDQLERINDYLNGSGYSGLVKVAKYDRGTSQAEREALRKNPPHILLTNYMMLEYLLVRPADREDMFANHRCKFLVLDEVHTYRGALGSNIALLVRRLKAHLKRARQDWDVNPENNLLEKRFPKLVIVGTSATIKSETEELSIEEGVIKRDREIKGFFSKLTGAEETKIKVLGEKLLDISIPKEARYAKEYREIKIDFMDLDSVRRGICNLAGIDETTDMTTAVNSCRILWDLNSWLIKKPMSVTELVQKIKDTIAERKEWNEDLIRKEVILALLIGGVLSGEMPVSLKIKVHQFFRGGWKFYRCVNPKCGKLYPKGEEKCECGSLTAPLYLCRNCGADYLRFVGDEEPKQLLPAKNKSEGQEWMLYQPEKFGELYDEEEFESPEEDISVSEMLSSRIGKKMKGKNIFVGSFDIQTLTFNQDKNYYPMKVILAPARNRCLCCGGTAGSRNVVSPVALGTSAGIKVLSEATTEALREFHKDGQNKDDKERLLIFSDSRQDAAHQARFIKFASRYDRMRRRIVYLLSQEKEMSIQRAIELLSGLGEQNKDNPYVPNKTSTRWISPEAKARIQIYEEVPLLDELAVNAGYRATVINLGLVRVYYNQLDEYIKFDGEEIIKDLGLDEDKFYYQCNCILDKIRTLGCLNREILTYHPSNLKCRDSLKSAEWNRSVKHPKGLPMDSEGNLIGYMAKEQVADGIKIHNPCSKLGAGGRGPAIKRIFIKLMKDMSNIDPQEEHLLRTLNFLQQGSFLVKTKLYGYRKPAELAQINSETIRIEIVEEPFRFKCSVCGTVIYNGKAGYPCPYCHGKLRIFTDKEVEESRYVRRIRNFSLPVLSAAEHTAQVSNYDRLEIEEKFKSTAKIDKLNVLACSPTLEMGIDVGGLDAILLRNIPPRPDNYAQRGGRAGRKQRMGLVLGYVRNTPHDQYFYDHPEEMIAGEVMIPQIALGNRDVILRHLNSIVFSAAEPGLAGKMVEYIDPKGEIKKERVDELIDGVSMQIQQAIGLAKVAWSEDILKEANLTDSDLKGELKKLPNRIRDVFNRTSRQVIELRQALDIYYKELKGKQTALRSGDLIKRLLGLSIVGRERITADDRSSGYPLRRFAEFAILPGYEFPSEPASVRLLRDLHEDELVNVDRRFGIAQYQPGAQIYARAQRWKVIGLDTSSPWNPYGENQGWPYQICTKCGLRYAASAPKCPRCRSIALASKNIIGVEYAGFLACRDESPVLDEEERYAVRSNVRIYPQWNGEVIGRWNVGLGWGLRLSKIEKVIWLNEGNIPRERERKDGLPLLHSEAKGFIVCSSCGKIIKSQLSRKNNPRGRRRLQNTDNSQNYYGHSPQCEKKGQPGDQPIAIFTENMVEILRLLVPIPKNIDNISLKEWGLSLGYALRAGMRHRYALDGREIEFIMEGPWEAKYSGTIYQQLSLTFIDPHIGGSGYLIKIAQEFNKVAEDARNYLKHKDCETSCYRCLKSYQNQRFHEYLKWPKIIGDLDMLAFSPVEQRSLEKEDIDDPTPWLEAYAAGVGSPLELKFLRLFEKYDLNVEKQVAIPYDRPISVADFCLKDKEGVAIYIDSATFHIGKNLRRDIFIRNRLRNETPPWRIIELRASDLRRIKEIIDDIKSLE